MMTTKLYDTLLVFLILSGAFQNLNAQSTARKPASTSTVHRSIRPVPAQVQHQAQSRMGESKQQDASRNRSVSSNQYRASANRTIIVTGYCPCKLCCGIYASKQPQTASGTVPQKSKTIACNFLPFKTRVKILGKIYTVEDRLAEKYKDRIDIFFNSHKEAKAFGKQTLTVTIIPKSK